MHPLLNHFTKVNFNDRDLARDNAKDYGMPEAADTVAFFQSIRKGPFQGDLINDETLEQ